MKSVKHIAYLVNSNHTSTNGLKFPIPLPGCTIELGSNWEHTDLYQTWENIGNPLILLLAVASLAGTSALIVCKLG